MAITVATVIALSLLTGTWPWPFVIAAVLILVAIIATCVAGLITQGKEYGRGQKIERAARLAEMERWYEREHGG